MISPTKMKRLMFLETMVHYMTAFIVILKGIDKVTIPGKAVYGIIFLAIGVLILLGTIFHHRAGKYLKHLKPMVFILEAIVIGLVGYLFLKEGKNYLQYLCFFAALMFVVATIVYLVKNKNSQQVSPH
jgi:hypothetical protein